MTNTFNIAGTDGSVMIPVMSETGSIMASLLYKAPTGILQEYYSQLFIPKAVAVQSQRFSLRPIPIRETPSCIQLKQFCTAVKTTLKHHLPDTHCVKRKKMPILTFFKFFLADTHSVRRCTSTCYNPYQFVFYSIFELSIEQL